MADATKRPFSSAVTPTTSRRATKAPEERQKRGRWVLPIVLAITFIVSLWFWFA